jgi:phytoene synthase
MNDKRQIFKTGSVTYFNSSTFFPSHIRADISTLYAFVRVADNYVDETPQDTEGFHEFRTAYENSLQGNPSSNPVIEDYVSLEKHKEFEKEWTKSFLDSMEMDLTVKTYATIDDVLKYMYGSAEVIGLMSAKIIGTPPESFECAKMLGRAMQYVNFIRDIAEDLELGRTYMPQEDLHKFGMQNLSENEARAKKDQFTEFIKFQIKRYLEWQAQAECGYQYIPRRSRIAVKTAGDMYHWTAQKIAANPFVIYQRKVKPAKYTILFRGILNSIKATVSR